MRHLQEGLLPERDGVRRVRLCLRPLHDGRVRECVAEFWLDQNLTMCRPYSALEHCKAPTHGGCVACGDGFFIQSQVCVECSAHTPWCTRCDAQSCWSCAPDHVLVDGKCVDFNDVEFCTEASDSKCTGCTFWHAPNADGTACQTRSVWWVIPLQSLYFSSSKSSSLSSSHWW